MELLSISKIILESRALNKEEMQGTIGALLAQSDNDNAKAIHKIVGNELLHYRPLHQSEPLLQMIWDVGESIRKRQLIEISYERMDQKVNKRVLKPVSILFSEYYFYLIAFMNKSDYQNPVVFRMDRIHAFIPLKEKFSYAEKDRLEEGILRQRIQFMYSGDLIRLQFKFYGVAVTPALDCFPNATVVGKLEKGWLIEAEVYGKGCLMRLLSQGERAELISPASLREEMKAIVQQMTTLYNE